MKTRLNIKNFRVFDENGVTFELNPITIMTGSNSSGKSTLVKAIFLLNSFLAQVTGSNAYGELLGLYAAAKGYDAIKVDSANYMVILNRTKIIISNEVDYV